ncbi:MAG: response regulator [Anaerolineae bacterium]|nr:response regulator [Anaerolineae bacterium]
MANERILVVDDEKGVVDSCGRILQRQGFTVLGKTDSTSVPKLLKKETFDLLLTDIRMPKIDGLKLLQLAKEIDPHLTVILITGYGTMEDAIKAIHLGAQGFLMKPFEPEDLIATIQDSLARRALLRDSLRLQTLLPLLEVNQILQGTGGETSLARRVLEIAQRETGAARLAWLSYQHPVTSLLLGETRSGLRPVSNDLVEMAVVPPKQPPASHLPAQAIESVLSQARPVWMLGDGALTGNIDGQPTIVGAVLPMLIKGEVVGVLAAETGDQGRASPFDQISLDLLSVLAGQLAMIIENVQLFNQTKTLHAFNEDIIQNMTNGLIAIDRDGRITAFNPAAAAMLDRQPEQVLYQLMPGAINDAPELVKIFQQTLATGQACEHQELTLHRPNGGQLSISVNTAPLLAGNENEQTAGVVGVLADLTERKALEAERRRLDRLAALGEMSAVVAHEIRNPMASIAAGVDYLALKTGKGSPEAEGAAMIQSEIQRVNRILEDILFVARPLQLSLSYENLADIIEKVIQRCQPQIEESQVTITTTYAPNVPLLKLDRQRLEQVFTNLIVNATQAMQSSGPKPAERKIQLQTKLSSPAKDAARASGQPSQAVIIVITDNGPGIPAEARSKIFEPFFTTKARGTGLGLTVARRIVEEHKGAIKIESTAQQGTSFIITLPIQREAAP